MLLILLCGVVVSGLIASFFLGYLAGKSPGVKSKRAMQMHPFDITKIETGDKIAYVLSDAHIIYPFGTVDDKEFIQKTQNGSDFLPD